MDNLVAIYDPTETNNRDNDQDEKSPSFSPTKLNTCFPCARATTPRSPVSFPR